MEATRQVEPRIQYARTSDGVNIAFWSIGEGIPVLQVPPVPWGHVGKEWDDPDYRTWYEMNSRYRRLIRYDIRGTALSDPIEAMPSVDEMLLDIDAVLDRLAVEKVALVGTSPGAAVAIAYAARRPDRVSHLIAWCPYARAADAGNPQWQSLKVMREADWNMYVETVAHAMVAGWDNPEAARRYAALMRASVSPDSPAARIMDQVNWMDVEPSLVQCPALILARAGDAMSMSSSRYLASQIPDAQLVVTEGASLLPWIGDQELVVRAIDRFLGLAGAAPQEPARMPAAGMVTILFTDIEGSTTLTQRLGDAAAQEVLRSHNEIVRGAIASRNGREIKHTGDGIMASFPLASAAIEAAVSIQRGVDAHGAQPAGTPLRVRVGLNAGEPVAEGSDLFGTSVQLARRVCDAAEPGAIVVTDVVRQLAAGKGFLFSDTGDVALKGFEEPVRLFTVSWELRS
jgi:class 3 adenylate cyclase/pimeloyl-ACP methyl ester carboxylesterase